MSPLKLGAPARFTRNILAPGWIFAFGVLLAGATPRDVTESALLFVVGVGIIPALLLIGGRRTPL